METQKKKNKNNQNKWEISHQKKYTFSMKYERKIAILWIKYQKQKKKVKKFCLFFFVELDLNENKSEFH